MAEAFISILGLAGTLLAGVISFILGQRWERQRQSLLIRAQMLIPIEEWLRGAERMIGILGDTMTSVIAQSPLPVTYDLEERRKATQFMIERTNVVLGILQSNSLRTGQTRKVLSRSLRRTITREFLIQTGETKLKLESDVQQAYSLIAQLKTALT